MDPYGTKWPLEDPWVAKSGQGTPQGGPKGESNGSNGGQEDAWGEPKWLQGRPWARQDAPKMTPGRPKGEPRGPKWHKMDAKDVKNKGSVKKTKTIKNHSFISEKTG